MHNLPWFCLVLIVVVLRAVVAERLMQDFVTIFQSTEQQLAPSPESLHDAIQGEQSRTGMDVPRWGSKSAGSLEAERRDIHIMKLIIINR